VLDDGTAGAWWIEDRGGTVASRASAATPATPTRSAPCSPTSPRTSRAAEQTDTPGRLDPGYHATISVDILKRVSAASGAWIASALLVIAGVTLCYHGWAYWAWMLLVAGTLSIVAETVGSGPVWWTFAIVYVVAGVVFGVRPIRRRLVTRPLRALLSRALPRMGETERIALEAGSVWWEGELFSGTPHWPHLLEIRAGTLSERERDFLAGPVERLCEMLDDFAIERAQTMPREIYDFLARERFYGLIIPERYGGLGFSALAHSAIVAKLASRSLAATVTVMVPSSLGPAELLLRYGTDAQRDHYLPRLARGEEIPCFALTGPEAGSDAAATQSQGIVCRGVHEGTEVLGMRLEWNKRYITLAPIATLIGLAFRLRDPEHLLGDRDDLGITCALVPAQLPGIEIGERHDPLGVPFLNGPTRGHDVFVPLDAIIGGPGRAGQGWRMLMECLAAGRSISLPSLSVGAAELCARASGAYATVREQFDTPIGRFEGVEEPLARIGGLTYMMNAARLVTVGAIDSGHQPAVASAIVKAYLTEGLRGVVADAMDIRAGAAICRGPRNMLARLHAGAPIGITVEGANILTRSMIIYGQGAIRCHPYVQKELEAFARGDLVQLDRALFGHLDHLTRNATRAFVHAVTRARLVMVPRASAPVRGYLRRLSRASAGFALISDAAMLTLGGQLKRREKLSGRLADALAWMYLASAAIKQFVDDGEPARDRAFLRWSVEHALHLVQGALVGVLDNLPNRPVAALLRALVFPVGARGRPPDDRLGTAAARSLLEDRAAREHLTRDIYLPRPSELGLGMLEAALEKALAATAVETKVRDLVRAARLDRAPGDQLLDRALAEGLISHDERRAVSEAEAARELAIQVDAFPGPHLPVQRERTGHVSVGLTDEQIDLQREVANAIHPGGSAMAPGPERVEDVMTEPVTVVLETATLHDVAMFMKMHEIGDVLVVDAAGKLRGIVTDRDLVVRGLAEGLDPETTRAEEVCSKHELVTVAPDATVDAAVELMRECAIRRLPVVKDDRPVGIISIGDLARARDPESALGRISSAPPNA
jgi:acyl-CoA dehydrogenase